MTHEQRIRPLDRVPAAALLAILGAVTLVTALDATRALRFPYPLDYGEGPLLDQAIRLAHGESIYRRDLSSPPFTVSNYPPLYPLLQVPWLWIAGPAYWYGRLLSGLGALASAVFLAGILHACTRDRTASAIAGLTFLSLPYVGFWAAFSRVDLPALAFSLAAVFVGMCRRDRWAMRVAAVLLVAAIFTRQTYALAAPAALVLWLAGSRETRKPALELAAWTGGLAAALFLALELVTHGGFSRHVIAANWNVFRPGLLPHYGRELLRIAPAPILASAVFLVLGRQRELPLWRFVALYSAGALLTAATIGKTGSNVNYLLELCAALSLAAGALVHVLAGRSSLRAACLATLALQAALWLGGTLYREELRSRLAQGDAAARLLQVVERAPGPVLADEAIGLLPLAGKRIQFQPFEMTQLARLGAWDPAPFLAQLDRAEFSAILLYRRPGSGIHLTRWEPEMLERIGRVYRPSLSVGATIVYVP